MSRTQELRNQLEKIFFIHTIIEKKGIKILLKYDKNEYELEGVSYGFCTERDRSESYPIKGLLAFKGHINYRETNLANLSIHATNEYNIPFLFEIPEMLVSPTIAVNLWSYKAAYFNNWKNI